MEAEDLKFEPTMTAAEALMWHVEEDPWLSPNGGSLTVFDGPLESERFGRAMAHATATVLRLRQRVVAPPTPLGVPRWVVDDELDLGWHVRHMHAPGDGSLRDLLDWMTLFLQDPYDRTRPLWQYVAIDGVEGGRGALAVKMHHAVTDGAGAVALGTAYTDLERDAPWRPEVDIEALVGREHEAGGGLATQVQRTVGDVVGSAGRATQGAARALLDALTNPSRLAEAGRDATDLVRTTSDQLLGAGSPVWRGRSRRRHLEATSLPFEAAHDAAKALGGTLNDLFVAGAVDAAARYHDVVGQPLERLHVSFVVSTKVDATQAQNAFSPVAVDIPVGRMTSGERFLAVRDVLHRRRDEVHGPGPLAAIAPVANLLPTSVVTSVARSQAGHLDLATSNLPGYLGASYVAGAKVEHTYVFGPVAGTACNLTAYTTAGQLDLGLHVDPAAIDDPVLLLHCLDGAFGDLLAEASDGGAQARAKRAKRPGKRHS